MERWRYVAMWPDYAIFWHGLDRNSKVYPMTAARRRRLEALLGDAIEPAAEGQSWLWSWNDWRWSEIARGGKR